MPIQVLWDDESQTVIRYVYEGQWTWSDAYAASDQALRLMNSVPYHICVIHDLTGSAGLPGGALSQGQLFTRDLPPNWQMSVVVGSGVFTETLLNAFSKIHKRLATQYRTAQTLAEARAITARELSK